MSLLPQMELMDRIVPSAGEIRVGTFVKTNAVQQIEILSLTSLHFVVIDAEHASFDRKDIDTLVLAGRAAGLPVLVRVADKSAATIQSVLDCGAAGLLLPHIDSADQAREVVSRARCVGGTRGFSNATRAAGYGTLPMADALRAVGGVLLIAQIECQAAVDASQEIAAVDGIGGLFVGRADLAVSKGGSDPRSADVLQASRQVIQAALDAGKFAGMAVSGNLEREEFASAGANWFVVGSDQSLLRQAGQAIAVAV